MLVQQLATGGDRNFAYIVADPKTGSAAIIDPSYAPEMVYRACIDAGFSPVYVFNTHRHHDHSNGNAEMEKLSGVKAMAFGDLEPTTGRILQDDTRLPLGEEEIHILHTPGHTEDSMCLLVGDAVFTGDTLFVGKVGGTGYGEDARQEYDSLHGKLMQLPDETRVFPGHDVGVEPQSTIQRERETNPFLQQPDYESFLDLKKNWLAYKRKHGIA